MSKNDNLEPNVRSTKSTEIPTANLSTLMPMMAPGEFFFKYAPRLNFLENGLFRFTQRTELNDPHECNPQILMESDSSEDIEVAEQKAREMGIPEDQMDRMLPSFLEGFSKRRFTREEFPGIPYPRGIKSIAEFDRRNAENELNALLMHIDETYGIFCVTRSSHNFRMWSHYADYHKGIVIGFDANHPFFKAAHDFYPVEYSPQRISLSSKSGMLRLAGYFHEQSHYDDLPIRLFLRKSLDWADEEEWRMVRKLEDSDDRKGENPPIYLFKIPREAIKVIILGAKMLHQNKERICQMISTTADWSHLQLMQAKLPESEFGVEIIPFNS